MTPELALLVALTRGGPQPPIAPDPPRSSELHIVVYDDDPASGARQCRIELADAGPGPATCEVQPTSAAPDVTKPGWANQFAPSWARHGRTGGAR